MSADALARFVVGAHPLVLAHDPDGLLDEAARAELVARGFRLVEEADPVRLWGAVDALWPWSAERPVLVVSVCPLNALPYDLWAQGHHVALSLADDMPNLSLPVVRDMTPAQRAKLGEAPEPSRRLGPRASLDHVLRHVFATSLADLRQPPLLLLWLNDVYRAAEYGAAPLAPLPAPLRRYLVGELSRLPAYYGWPLDEMLSDAAAYRDVLRRAWADHLAGRPRPSREDSPDYGRPFDDRRLQQGVGALVASGNLEQVGVDAPETLSPWEQPGVWHDAVGGAARALGEALEAVAHELEGAPDWAAWGRIARAWARATATAAGEVAPPEEVLARFSEAQADLDARFAEWLRRRYAPLSGQRLPRPHHVYHVPHWLAYRRGRGGPQRVALLVLDGLAWCDWVLVAEAWGTRHPDWTLHERALLAQVPTVTSISRQALVSGLRPEAFGDRLDSNAHESQQWRAHWVDAGLPPEGVGYAHLDLARSGTPEVVQGSRAVALCLVDHSLDALAHGASLGAAQMQADLRRWLADYAPALEALIDDLLGRGFGVHIASDHGHVEAVGYGRPSEGIVPEMRAQRARLYRDAGLARGTREGYHAILWHDDGLLPDDVHVVMPAGRQAFVLQGQRIVTHGGITLDEVMVPFVSIEKVT